MPSRIARVSKTLNLFNETIVNMTDDRIKLLILDTNVFSQAETQIFDVAFIMRCPCCCTVSPSGFTFCMDCLTIYCRDGSERMPACLAAALPFENLIEVRAMQVARVKMWGMNSNGIRSEEGTWWKTVREALKWRKDWPDRSSDAIHDMAIMKGMSPRFPGRNTCIWAAEPVDGQDMGPSMIDICQHILAQRPGAQGEEDALLLTQVDQAVTYSINHDCSILSSNPNLVTARKKLILINVFGNDKPFVTGPPIRSGPDNIDPSKPSASLRRNQGGIYQRNIERKGMIDELLDEQMPNIDGGQAPQEPVVVETGSGSSASAATPSALERPHFATSTSSASSSTFPNINVAVPPPPVSTSIFGPPMPTVAVVYDPFDVASTTVGPKPSGPGDMFAGTGPDGNLVRDSQRVFGSASDDRSFNKAAAVDVRFKVPPSIPSVGVPYAAVASTVPTGSYAAVAATMPTPPEPPLPPHLRDTARARMSPAECERLGVPPLPSWMPAPPPAPEPRVRAPSSQFATHDFEPRVPKAPTIPGPHLAQGGRTWVPNLRAPGYTPFQAQAIPPGKGLPSSSSAATPTKGDTKGKAQTEKGYGKGDYKGKGKGKVKGTYPGPWWVPTFQSQNRPWDGNQFD